MFTACIFLKVNMSLGTSTGVTVSSDDKSIIQSSELSFAGKGLKLDSDQDGKLFII